jgi:hypothetical protein
MFTRNGLIPVLIVVVIGAPIVYHETHSQPANQQSDHLAGTLASQPNASPNGAYRLEPTELSSAHISRNVSQAKVVPMESPFILAGFPKQIGDPSSDLSLNPSSVSNAQDDLVPIQAKEQVLRFNQSSRQIILTEDATADRTRPNRTGQIAHTEYPAALPSQPAAQPINTNSLPTGTGIDFNSMMPDYGAAETYYFPGNEFGPDLSAEPLENLPVQNLQEIFRFDLSKAWVQSRWKRISTNPIDYGSGLTGLRVPLVTGTNTWDLHGSLTYFFDDQQQLQRITFRGWTGNPGQLLQLLQSQFQFKSQPTNLAGFYLAESWRKTTGGMMMKTPAVIDSSNPYQQYGVVLEINNPQGPLELSDDFVRLIEGSHPR